MSGLVKELNYSQIKSTAVPSRPVINRYRSNNSSHTANQWIEIEIQTGTPGLHLFPHDSFIEGIVDVVVTAAAAKLDGNCFSLFRTMEVVIGGQVVERQSFCGKLWHVLNDIMMTTQERQYQTISHGGDGVTGYSCPVGTTSIPFAFTLPSSILGSLSTKALPLSLLYNSSIVLRLELDNGNNWCIDTGATSAVIGATSNVHSVYYNAKCSMLPSDIESALISSTNGQILLPAVGYAGEYKQINSASSSYSDKFSFQYDSLNSIIFWMMVTSGQNVTTHHSQTSKLNCNMNEFQININGERYPSAPIGHPVSSILAQPIFITEMRRAFDMLGTTAGCNFSNSVYGSDPGNEILSQYDVDSARNVYALDLNRFNASQESMFSGINTRGQQLSLNISYSTGTPDNLYLYAVAMFDVLYTIEGGLMTARY